MKSENNLNLLRLIAATLVLIGHSYIFLGLPEPVFLSGFTLGPLGVYIFFSISGYLISESWDQDPHAKRFLIKRALRIFPALIFCTFASIILLGPWLTTLSLQNYFNHPATRGYLTNIFLYITYHLPGVFENLRVPNAVNGSLWSLPIEFFLYIAIIFLGLIKSKKWIYFLLATSSMLITNYWAFHADMIIFYRSDVRQLFFCGTYFWVGATLYKFNGKKYFSKLSFCLATIALLTLQFIPFAIAKTAWILIPVAALSFGFSRFSWLSKLTSKNDYSYGVYIYAFPIQQSIIYLIPEINIILYITLCASATLVFSIASWHLIEKQALNFKPKRIPHQ